MENINNKNNANNTPIYIGITVIIVGVIIFMIYQNNQTKIKLEEPEIEEPEIEEPEFERPAFERPISPARRPTRPISPTRRPTSPVGPARRPTSPVGPIRRPSGSVRSSVIPMGPTNRSADSIRSSIRPMGPTSRTLGSSGRSRVSTKSEKEKEKSLKDVLDDIVGIPNTPTENCKIRHPGIKGVFGNIKGSCWQCPDGYTRNTINIIPTDRRACVSTKKAHIYGNVEPVTRTCKAIFGNRYFGDPSWTDRCWTCPNSHPHRSTANVNSNKACVKNLINIIGATGSTKKANFKFVTRDCRKFNKKAGFEHPRKYLNACFGCPDGYTYRKLRNPRNNDSCGKFKKANKLSEK